jgi:hypothetical protein
VGLGSRQRNLLRVLGYLEEPRQQNLLLEDLELQQQRALLLHLEGLEQTPTHRVEDSLGLNLPSQLLVGLAQQPLNPALGLVDLGKLVGGCLEGPRNLLHQLSALELPRQPRPLGSVGSEPTLVALCLETKPSQVDSLEEQTRLEQHLQVLGRELGLAQGQLILVED